MAYFDDMHIIDVTRFKTARNRVPSRVEVGALGVMRGGASRFIDGRTVSCDKPFVYWSVPGKVYAWRTLPGTVRENVWFAAVGDRFQRMLAGLQELSGDDLLPVSDAAPFLVILGKMEKLRLSLDVRSERRTLMIALAEQFVAEIYASQRAGDVHNRLYEVISELAARIRKTPGDEYDFKKIASANGVSYDHFRFRFNEYCGLPPHQFCLDARLDAALEMLSSGIVSIKETAWRCGFAGASDFARFFRKKIGCSPSGYRRSS